MGTYLELSHRSLQLSAVFWNIFSFHSSDYVICVNCLQICESFLLWFQCTLQPIKNILHFRYFTFQFWNSHWVLLIVFISLQNFLIVYSYLFFYLSPWKILSSCMLISIVMSFQYLFILTTFFLIIGYTFLLLRSNFYCILDIQMIIKGVPDYVSFL